MGLPIPEDVALLAGGFLAHRGVIQYPMTLLVALLGVVAGDNLLFFLGRRFGTGLVKYLGIGRPRSQRQIDWLKGFMERHGHRAILYARFVAGLRALVYLTAGSFGVNPLRFFLYDLAGAVISVPIVVTLGYLFGGQIEAVLEYIGGVEKLVWLVVALSLGVIAMRMLMFTREHGETPT
jgi:membrane protein DedA with SNARE-associated domain